ncbi:DUF1569 domain-containing protein [Candidatus Parcubacteria bacterium]|nr:MAG: DUF1569 domain-containing protein [Candidatus Parcubacteria bacterium]
MQHIFRPEVCEQLQVRIRHLRPETPVRWGRSNAHQIVCHLSDQVRLALGEIPGAPASGALSRWPLNKLLIHVLPWPKGAPTPKEAWSSKPGDWQADVDTLSRLLEQLAQAKADAWPAHPLFGKMSGRDWARLTYRHFDHHLRQFGV